jgi:hypothetical protein
VGKLRECVVLWLCVCVSVCISRDCQGGHCSLSLFLSLSLCLPGRISPGKPRMDPDFEILLLISL